MHPTLTHVFALLLTAATLAAQDMRSIYKNIDNPDLKTRIAAMKQLAEVASRESETIGKAAFPAFVKSLSDPDRDMRYNAISGIAATVVAAQWQLRNSRNDPLNVGNLPLVKTNIEKLLDDPDELIRANALRAYVNIYELNAELQGHLISQLSSEGITGNQELILESLADTRLPSEPTVACLIKNLYEPKYSHRIAWTWAHTENSPPSDALPKLAELLSTSSESSDRQAYGMAIAKYGAAAKPYLREIEALRDKETDPTARESLKTVADSIRGR